LREFQRFEIERSETRSGENMMKKIFLGTVGLIALSLAAPASAADLAARPYTKAPPPPPPVYDWSGFYIGGNGGWGTSRKCWDLSSFAVIPGGAITTLPALVSEGCHDANGGTAGGQIGYRWQTGSWVWGIEGQGNWADFSSSRASLLFPTTVINSKIDSFGLITGQIGYAWNNVLLYVKGGAAVTGNKFELFDPTIPVDATANTTRWGGTVGVGVEVGFASNWSIGVEYDHLFMGSRDVNFNAAGVFFQDEHISQGVDMGLVRLNYRFGGWGAPVAARY
jgi:outer membrane immunogenic protein